ncbi:MAG: terminase small subunit [Alicyclobacillus macrosporangiidus]|uniref:terminase small subunit n=1 Tax=Alicyclobacillus macrosporangiidus TaxID=392015 RepID=UPI0026F04BBA|nr:terminase small subunit [Alicyclobacillus macrosporangiidus]MCL6597956.1 terminase small subunit [Alicyclobacillus macrosporangiidus]
MKLTPKQKAFADYYIETGNATESYRRAGYKARGNAAEVNASRLLSTAKVRAYIDERMRQKDEERIASQDEILEFLTRVMRGELTEQVPVVLQNDFEIVDKTPSLKDRTKAAELLGKRYMMWTDRQTVDATHTVTFVDDLDE